MRIYPLGEHGYYCYKVVAIFLDHFWFKPIIEYIYSFILSPVKDPSTDSCEQVICREYDIRCPRDSTILQAPLEPGECCPPPPTCDCNLSLCSVILCTGGYERRIEVTGNGEPGTCCDVYECVKGKAIKTII